MHERNSFKITSDTAKDIEICKLSVIRQLNQSGLKLYTSAIQPSAYDNKISMGTKHLLNGLIISRQMFCLQKKPHLKFDIQSKW